MATDAIEVTCRSCNKTGPIPAHYAETWTGECAACMRDRADAALGGRHRNFEGSTADVDPRERMRMADDGAPAADVVDAWLDSDFPNRTNTAAPMDGAPAEARDGMLAQDAGSRHGSRDADGIKNASSAGADSTHAFSASAQIPEAGAGLTPVPALSSSAGAGALARGNGASVPFSTAVACGDLTDLCKARPVVSSDNLSFLSPARTMRLRRDVFRWLSEVA